MRRIACSAGIAIVATATWALPGGAIPCLSGFVRDRAGTPIANVDLDLFDAATGTKLITSGDDTDTAGFYNICVLPGIYDVTYSPPPGTRFLGAEVHRVELTSDPGREIDIVLETGTVVSGHVRTADGMPLGAVDADVDRVTGGRIFTPNDDSDAETGAYRLVLPNGDYRIRFKPPRGERWQGMSLEPVVVARDTLIEVVLPPGVLLQGSVRVRGGDGLPAVSVDLRRWGTGERVFLANNSTNSSGEYIVAAPTGTFEMRLSPPRGQAIVAGRIDSVAVSGDARFDVELEPGFLLTVEVRDPRHAPIAGADVDLFRAQDGGALFAPHDRTDSGGRAEVALAAGTYTLEVDPPTGSAFDRVLVENLGLDADLRLPVELPEVARVRILGRVVDDGGAPVPGVVVQANRQPRGEPAFVPNDRSDAAGMLDLSLPVGMYEVRWLPPRGSRLVGRVDAPVSVVADSSWGEVVLDFGLLCDARVVDQAGRPVPGADFDFTAFTSGIEVFTPYDNTDANGEAQIVLRAGRYRAQVTPPAGSEFEPTEKEVSVQADTHIEFVLTAVERPSRMILGRGFPNPFRVSTAMSFELFSTAEVVLTVRDAAGRIVRVLDRGVRPRGVYDRTWDGIDGHGRPVASGVYFVRLETQDGWEARKLILVR